jgi:hypothetical protein
LGIERCGKINALNSGSERGALGDSYGPQVISL